MRTICFKMFLISSLLMMSLSLRAQFGYFEVDGIFYEPSWENEDEVYVISENYYYGSPVFGGSNTYWGKVEIPEKVTYDGKTYDVTGIRDMAFAYCYGLDSVIIPPSVKTIEASAFYECGSLSFVKIPTSITEIPDQAFYGCYGLSELDLPSSIILIGEDAFEYSGLIKIKIPESVKNIGKYAFSRCSELEQVELPSGLETISDGLFSYCQKLPVISIPLSVTSIGSRAFSGCSEFESITISEGIKTIGSAAFNSCKKLTTLVIPGNVESIAETAFEGCNNLESIRVDETNTHYDSRENCNAIIETASNRLIQGCNKTTIPHNITSISDYAFMGCTEITSLFIPKSLTDLKSSTFQACKYIESIVVEEGNPVYDSRNGCNAIILTQTNKLVLGCKNTTIPAGIDTIGSGAFRELTLTSIVIPEGVKCIESRAFYGCGELQSVTLPSTLVEIGSSAFYMCRKVTSVALPDGLIKIGASAFGSTGLKTLSIPGMVTTLGSGAFSDCDFESVIVPDNVVTVGDRLFSGCDYLKSAVLPDNWETVPSNMFSWCPLESVNIPDSATYIGEGAFSGCNFETLIIPDKVKEIGCEAFRENYNLKSITLPQGLERIGYNAFRNDNALDTIYIPSGVTLIEYGAFYECQASFFSIPPSVELQWEPFSYDPEYGRFPFDGNYEAVIHVRGHKQDAKFLEDYYIESSFGEMFYYDWDVEYKLRFVVDNAEFAAFDVSPYTELNTYAQTIGTPLKTGCEFVEWKTLPTLMPEGDLTVYAVFTKIRYCAVPTVGYANGQLRFDCETPGATVVTEIFAPDAGVFEDNVIQLTKAYIIKAVAKADGYANSDTLKVLLGWIDASMPENIDDGVVHVKTLPVMAYLNGSELVVKCPFEGQEINVYSVDGRLLIQSRIIDGTATFNLDSLPTGVIIIKIADKSLKVKL